MSETGPVQQLFCIGIQAGALDTANTVLSTVLDDKYVRLKPCICIDYKLVIILILGYYDQLPLEKGCMDVVRFYFQGGVSFCVYMLR